MGVLTAEGAVTGAVDLTGFCSGLERDGRDPYPDRNRTGFSTSRANREKARGSQVRRAMPGPKERWEDLDRVPLLVPGTVSVASAGGLPLPWLPSFTYNSAGFSVVTLSALSPVLLQWAQPGQTPGWTQPTPQFSPTQKFLQGRKG